MFSEQLDQSLFRNFIVALGDCLRQGLPVIMFNKLPVPQEARDHCGMVA